MSDSSDGGDDIEDIRARKREELAARAGGSDAPDEPVPVTGSAELRSLVDEHEVVLADFYADWCGPCRMVAPMLESIAVDTDVVVAKVDVDANQPLAAEYEVSGIPTLLLFVDGDATDRLVGAHDEATLREFVDA